MPKKSLDQQIRDNMAGSKQTGTFAPGPGQRAPAKDKEPIPDLRMVVESPIEQKILARLVLQYREAQQAEREAKAVKDEHGAEIKKRLTELGVQKFLVEDLRVNYSTSERNTLKKDLLLAEGVRPDVIARCTKTTPVTMLTIRGIDEAEPWEKE